MKLASRSQAEPDTAAIVADRIQALYDLPTLPAVTRVVYHVGFLAPDRSTYGRDGKPKSEPDKTAAYAIDQVGDLAWQLHKDGKALLTQRRIGKEMFEYIAIRRRVFGRA